MLSTSLLQCDAISDYAWEFQNSALDDISYIYIDIVKWRDLAFPAVSGCIRFACDHGSDVFGLSDVWQCWSELRQKYTHHNMSS